MVPIFEQSVYWGILFFDKNAIHYVLMDVWFGGHMAIW